MLTLTHLTRARCLRGFTLVELLVTVAVLALLLLLGAPQLTGFVRNAQVRTAADALQNGMRLAQAESVRRNRLVVFVLTNDPPGLAAEPVATGRNWAVATIPALTGEAREFAQGGELGAQGAALEIDGPAIVCFNGLGRRVTVAAANTGFGVACAVDPDDPVGQYNIALPGADRPLRVTVNLGGQVRMCDPAKALSAANPDGCPA